MLYTKKFVFTVSLCAMLAVNPVLAETNLVEVKAGAKSGTPGVVSEVYSDWAGRADSGIAGVRYVNSAVDAAGNAAQWAENHAAAAAISAQEAASSAAQAASKVAIAQGENNKNKAMVTNGKGEVSAGYVTSDMISSSGYVSGVLMTDSNGVAEWGKVEPGMINSSGYRGYVSGVLITDSNGGAKWAMLEPGMINSSGYSGVLVPGLFGGAEWGNVPSEYVYAGTGASFTGEVAQVAVFDESGQLRQASAVTGVFAGWMEDGGVSGRGTGVHVGFTTDAEKAFGTGTGILGSNVLTYDDDGKMGWGKIGPKSTSGIVGMVPVGSATSTEYGQLWIE